MKKILCFILSAAVLGFLLTACKPKVDVVKETAAVKAVIDAETQAYADKNSVAFKDLYIQDEFQTRAALSGPNLDIMDGWNKLKVMADSVQYYDWSEVKDFKFKHDFIMVKVIGNVAWAIFKTNEAAIYKGTQMSTNDLQTMVLEKVDGKWKISCFVSANIPVPPPPPPPPPPPTVKDKKVKK
jgi:outer membrane biosynthesis protein TonB